MPGRDEFFHEPTNETYWSESHYLDFVADEVQGHARIGFYPNQESVNVWAYLLDGDDIYWVDEENISPSKVHGLLVREDQWTYGMLPEKVGEQWRVIWNGTATKSTSPADVLAGSGEAVDIDIEFTTTARHEPFYYSECDQWESEGDRYEVASYVKGTADLNGRTVMFEGPGERDHSWDPRKWAGDTEWLWISGAFEDGTAYNHVTGWARDHRDETGIYGFWYDGDRATPLTDAAVRATPEFGHETARTWAKGDAPEIELDLAWSGGSTTVVVEPFATTPLDYLDEERAQRALFNRSAARQEKRDGVTGVGWLENPTQIDLD